MLLLRRRARNAPDQVDERQAVDGRDRPVSPQQRHGTADRVGEVYR